MKIAFHGAARTVTGSKHLISLNNGKKDFTGLWHVPGFGQRNISAKQLFWF